jgi:hypothetical protein
MRLNVNGWAANSACAIRFPRSCPASEAETGQSGTFPMPPQLGHVMSTCERGFTTTPVPSHVTQTIIPSTLPARPDVTADLPTGGGFPRVSVTLRHRTAGRTS